VLRLTSPSTVMTFTPFAWSFFISSTIDWLSAWITLMAMPATSSCVAYWRSRSI